MYALCVAETHQPLRPYLRGACHSTCSSPCANEDTSTPVIEGGGGGAAAAVQVWPLAVVVGSYYYCRLGLRSMSVGFASARL